MSAIKETFFHGELKVEVKRERLDSRFMHIDVFHPNTFGAKGKFAGALELDSQTGSVNWYDPEKDESVRLFEGGEDPRCQQCDVALETGNLCEACRESDLGVPVSKDGVYLAWTSHDALRAQAEGWAIFDTGTCMEIERDDVLSMFEDDNAAIDWVVKRAKEHSKMHQRALAIHEAGVCHNVAIVEAYGGAYFLAPRAIYPRWREENPTKTPCPACDGEYELMWLPTDVGHGHAAQLVWDDGAIVQVEVDRIDEDVRLEAMIAKERLLIQITPERGLSTFPPEPMCQCDKKGGRQ